MRVYEAQALSLPASVMIPGAFDGVHRGHQALLRRGMERARALSVPAVAYTFDPPPKSVFESARILTSREEKVSRLRDLGLDYAVIANFDADYASRSAEDFLQELGKLNPLEIWTGADFRFGSGGEGDLEMLGEHFTTHVMSPVHGLEGYRVSSSKVRQLLAQGEMVEAHSLLGWSVSYRDFEGYGPARLWFLDYEDAAALMFFSGDHHFLEQRLPDEIYTW